MNKKLSLGLTLALCILTSAVTFAVTMGVSRNIYNKIINNLSLRTSESAALDEIDRIVSSYYYGSAEHKTADITSSLIEGYVSGLNDENCGYLSSGEYSEYKEKLTGALTGIGIETLWDASRGGLVITWVYENSPAATAGLAQGDVIEEIDNTPVTAKNRAELSQKLYGGRLNGVKIAYSRNGETNTVQPMMGFTIPTVITQMNGSTAIIRISAFFNNTPDEFRKAVDAARKNGAAGFIFDLRGTNEGTVENAAKVLDVLVPVPSDGRPLAAAYDKKGTKLSVFTAESSSVNSGFAVLVNSLTSGAAELFACDLHDICSSPVIGTATAGVGTVQQVFALESGDAVVLTVARLEPFNPDSAYDKTGVAPTVAVDAPEASQGELLLTPIEKDAAMQAALSVFK